MNLPLSWSPCASLPRMTGFQNSLPIMFNGRSRYCGQSSAISLLAFISSQLLDKAKSRRSSLPSGRQDRYRVDISCPLRRSGAFDWRHVGSRLGWWPRYQARNRNRVCLRVCILCRIFHKCTKDRSLRCHSCLCRRAGSLCRQTAQLTCQTFAKKLV